VLAQHGFLLGIGLLLGRLLIALALCVGAVL